MSRDPKPKPYPPRILTAEEAALHIGQNGKDRETLRRWRLAGIGPPFVEIGQVAYYRSDLLEMNHPIQGRVDAFPASWEEQQTINEISLARLLLLQVLDNWKEDGTYRLSADGYTKTFRSRAEIELYLKALNHAMFAIEAERATWEPSQEIARGREREKNREGLSGNRIFKILDRLVEAVEGDPTSE